MRALLGTAPLFCHALVLKLITVANFDEASEATPAPLAGPFRRKLGLDSCQRTAHWGFGVWVQLRVSGGGVWGSGENYE